MLFQGTNSEPNSKALSDLSSNLPDKNTEVNDVPKEDTKSRYKMLFCYFCGFNLTKWPDGNV